MARKRISRRLEDYLKAVLVLCEKDGAARVSDIAARTEVSKPTVTAALKQLSLAGLVDHDPYQFVKLTEVGMQAARKVHARHELLVDFLVRVLGVDAEVAEANACRMEHVVDDRVLSRLNMLAEFIQQYSFEKEDWLECFLAYCRNSGTERFVPGGDK